MGEAVGADVETTLYGDLPEDFWGRSDAPEEHGSGPAHADPPAGGSRHAGGGAPGPAGVGAPAESEESDAVPLFVPADGGVELPRPRTPTRGEPPLEPEGERFAQLQALFPGRIIEVSRKATEAPAGAAGAGGPADDPTTAYDGPDGYATPNDSEAADEPRYDTAAEAAAEESG